MKRESKILGILGGMGPASTVRFLDDIVENTAAGRDQDHIPFLLYNLPQVPDRTLAYTGEGRSPIDSLVNGIELLKSAGASLIAIPCNSAHLWLEEMRSKSGVEILDMVRLASDRFQKGDRVGLLGTTLTVKSRLYENLLVKRGIEVILPEDQDFVMKQIRMIKGGDLSLSRKNLKLEAQKLIDEGATHILEGCTEVPLVLNSEKFDVPLVDPMIVLARESIKATGGKLKDSK